MADLAISDVVVGRGNRMFFGHDIGGRTAPNASVIIRIVVLAASIFFLSTTFRYGWNRPASDFPNYYTAAVLVRKGEPLRKYYDWTWFQRQMNYAGLEQLGAYVPQGPLTMLPMVGLAGFRVQTAKRVWLIFNLGLLITIFWLISRMTRFSMTQIALVAFLGYGTLHINFLYGQYYVFLLFLFSLAFYCFERGYARNSGFLIGAVFGLKLYGGPFLPYLAAKRYWRTLLGMIFTVLCLSLLAIAIFSSSDIAYYANQVLPRALKGETIDPYNSLNGTLSTLLRRAFMMEPELNPHPVLHAPGLFFFLQPLLTLAVLVFPLLAVSQSSNSKRDFAWFFLAIMLASPNTGLYSFILLLLPVMLLMEMGSRRHQTFLVICYILLAMPMRPAWSWLFPRVWLLLALFLTAGHGYWRLVRLSGAVAALLFLTVSAAFSARRQLASYAQEPGQRWQRVAVQPGAIFSSSPAILRSGVVYQAIGKDRYVLRWYRQGQIKEFRFNGEALQPSAKSPDGPIRFELVSNRSSTRMLFDPVTNELSRDPISTADEASSSILSPDRKWTADTEYVHGSQQIRLRSTHGGLSVPLTGGNCNSWSPAWELDSKAVVFASDCGRGIGCPALYRARLNTK